MASKSFEAGYEKYFGKMLVGVSRDTTEEHITNVYRDFASQYDKNMSSARYAMCKPLAECLDSAIPDDFPDRPKDKVKIVDAGAGTGFIGVELSKLGYTDLSALDISQEMLDKAKEKNVYKNFICASLSDHQIPEIKTGEFDALICGGTLVKGHVRSSAFVEMVRIVKKGGLLCFNIRVNELEDYQAKMLELEGEGKWEKISQKTIPLYATDDMPKETLAFLYRVLKT